MQKNYLLLFMAVGVILLLLMVNMPLWTALPEKTNATQEPLLKVYPIPEFAKVSSLALSEDLIALYDEGRALLAKALELGLTALVLVNEDEGMLESRPWFAKLDPPVKARAKQIKLVNIPHDTIWIRDFGPGYARWLGKPSISKSSFVDFIYRSDVIINDTVPYMLALYLHKSLESIPVILDGGSFLSNGSTCLVSVESLEAGHLLKFGKITGKASVSMFRNYLKHFVGCQKLVIFPNAAHEHVDMWAKIVNHDTVLVNEISDEILSDIASKHGPLNDEVFSVKRKLDEAAEILGDYFNVVRIPMPIPDIDVFRTYANALLINGHAILPSYSKIDKNGVPLLDAENLESYEEQVSKVFKDFHYKVSFINADEVIADGGALHCVGLQLPD